MAQMCSYPKIMGILNCTPDSFYDGGRYSTRQDCIDAAMRMSDEGADIIDVGGESTRPGAASVTLTEEIERTIPVIEKIRSQSPILLSIDTTKSEVAKLALKTGATYVNDISGLREDSQMPLVVEEARAFLIIMHSRGTPQNMQEKTHYHDVVQDVTEELQQGIKKAKDAGIETDKIIIDPGFGFAKEATQNITLLKGLKRFKSLGYPLMVGLSRKSFIGFLLNLSSPKNRLAGTLAASYFALTQGADILRVHDVRDTKDIIKVYHGLNKKE